MLNGQRGTVKEIEEPSRSLRVEIDGQDEVVLPASYLEAGHVSLGYAMTVHKSQGMTAERTYVLGSAELYRELGYTALSRHRDECRFYLNGGDPSEQLELEVAGEERDKVFAQMERAMGRSRAQEMALDVHDRDEALRRLPDDELAARAGRLSDLLDSYPAAARDAERHAGDLARLGEKITGARDRLDAARAQRHGLGLLARRERSELDERIAHQGQVLAANQADYDERAQLVTAGRMAGDEWVERRGMELAEATVVERELLARRAELYEDAIAMAAHDPSSDLAQALGPRPDSLLERERWDQTAAAIEGYRLRYGELPEDQAPSRGPRRAEWERTRIATRALERLQGRDIARGLDAPEALELDGPGLDLAD